MVDSFFYCWKGLIIINFERLTESDKKRFLKEARNEYMRNWYANRTEEQRERDREKRRQYMREYYRRRKNQQLKLRGGD